MSDTLLPAGWGRPHGYSNGMSAVGRIVVTAGQIGWDPLTEHIESNDFVAQVRRALDNVVQVLRAGGAEPEHVVRLTWYLTDRDAYLSHAAQVGSVYREIFGRHFPAMSVVVVAGLVEPRAKVEIEATAVVPHVEPE